jgi:ATP-dependent protease HslVU (ClpYQ) ATPase subunit|tara:strand:+ start:75 stop:446 length:372 start_codon:yes stop_codon:yes gene_type:complete
MSVKELIQKASDKDATGFESAFSDVMSDKMMAAIEAKYTAMFSAEEVETSEEDELSEVAQLATKVGQSAKKVDEKRNKTILGKVVKLTGTDVHIKWADGKVVKYADDELDYTGDKKTPWVTYA